MPIRILLADDHLLFRYTLASSLGNEPDMTVAGEASNGRECLHLALDLAPDVVVMDVSMPNLNGMEAARQITEANGRIKVVALSMHSNPTHVLRMLQAGASAYVLKTDDFAELTSAIRRVHSGKAHLCPEAARHLLDSFCSHGEDFEAGAANLAAPLSPREREVLQLISEGHTNKDIARILGISLKTVESHRAQIINKTGYKTVAELTKHAIREGLTSL